ncbi:metal-dependent hydrolase [Amycolatopsis thailandensis]|uniref:metal-dependent hydrolase n=1 Tax=Amycolatopsis thailandensis TaxID=589330 RepID=UPI00365DD676
MMGRTHALTGWCAGLAAAPLAGLAGGPQVLVFAATTAGFALLPDLDHPGATASRFLGRITGGISRLLRWSSRRLYAVTKGPRDERCSGQHRHLSHTVLFALALGALTAVGTAAGGRWAVLAVLLFGLLLADHVLGDLVGLAGAAGFVTLMVKSGGLVALDGVQVWLGIAVALGCVVHDLGDAVTESGCPFLFPLLIAGETWYEIRPPQWLRFRTGKGFETWIVFPVLVVLSVMLVPGVLEAV